MNGRERLIEAIHHRPTDRPPIDLGATAVTGIHASTLYGLRRALGLEERPITVHEVFQQLGSVEPDVLAALSIDVVGLWNPTNFVGVRNDSYRSGPPPRESRRGSPPASNTTSSTGRSSPTRAGTVPPLRPSTCPAGAGSSTTSSDPPGPSTTSR
jgi:hypothetical protein